MIKNIVERKLKEAMSDSESGFTLIELLVVMLIIGILLAIAIPTFLGVINTAHNTSAQSNLGNAIIEANAIYTQDSQAFGSSSNGAAGVAGELQIMEPSLTFYSENRAVMSTGTNNIGSAVQVAAFDCNSTASGCQIVVMSAFASQSGTCYYVLINKNANVGSFDMFGLTVAAGGGTYYATQSQADGASGANTMSDCSLNGVSSSTGLPSTAVITGVTDATLTGAPTTALPTKVGWTSGAGGASVGAKGTSAGAWQSGQFPS